MLGAGTFHGYAEENRPQCDNIRLAEAELQLVGHVPIQSGGATTIGIGNFETRPIKRIREEEPHVHIPTQKLGGNLSNSIYQDKHGHTGSRINPNPVPTRHRHFVDKKERISSVNSTCENMTNALTGVLSLGNSSIIKMEIDRQTEELCQFIKQQVEYLYLLDNFKFYSCEQEENILKGGRELNKRHTISLLNALENAAHTKMHEKELQLENISLKNKELEDRIKRVTMEVQWWHNRAKYNLSVANVLKSSIQQIMTQGSAQGREGFGDSNEVDDADSCMNRTEIIGGCGNQEIGNQRLRCRACRNRQVSVLLFPCRHLCLCFDCERVLEVCPVCRVMKTGSFLVCM